MVPFLVSRVRDGAPGVSEEGRWEGKVCFRLLAEAGGRGSGPQACHPGSPACPALKCDTFPNHHHQPFRFLRSQANQQRGLTVDCQVLGRLCSEWA